MVRMVQEKLTAAINRIPGVTIIGRRGVIGRYPACVYWIGRRWMARTASCGVYGIGRRVGAINFKTEGGRAMIDFEQLQRQAYENAFEKGFWDGVESECVKETFLKLHEEAVEAEQCWRAGETAAVTVNGKPCGLPAELADGVLVIMNLAERMGIDLETQILRKLKYNAGRAYRHGDGR